MADLQEKNKWETGIYQIEENDPVQGGSDGITNKPIKQLANRTKYLKNEVEKKYEEKPATTEEAGTVQLVDNLTTNDNTKALTANQGFSLKGYIDSLTRNLSNCIPNSKKSSTVSSDSEDTIATSKAVKTAYEKAEAAKTLAESKQSPATTLAGYGITNFKVQDDLATANLNDITTAGIYGQPYDRQATTARNYPVNKAGSLIVKPSAYGVMQEYVVYDSKQYYCRNETRNGWGEWKTIGADKADLHHTHSMSEITDLNFTQNLTQNGWCRLPNGLIFQWGYLSKSSLRQSHATVTFPISFTEIFNVSLTIKSQEVDGDHAVDTGVYNLTNQSFRIFSWWSGGNFNGFYWTAIGK